ncbi:MAG: cellulase family glycosylhydrolase [Bacteriovoracales bacterium]
MKHILIFFLSIISLNTYSRDLSFLDSKKSIDILIGEKKYGDFKDKIFKDGLGRERYFRGWNISNSFKGPPYHSGLNPDELDAQIKNYKERTGSNIVRYLILWAAAHPQVDIIDYAYLQKTVEALKNFAAREIYVLLDWHQDLFAMGGQGKWEPGDGPPEWVVQGMHLPSGSCGLICLSWSQNYFTNRAVKAGLRHFWNNEKIDTIEGKRTPQEEFIWQMKITLNYIKSHLTAKEYSYIVGIDPWNEPAEGGLRNYNPPLSPAEWHEQKLWPFYKNIRSMANLIGWEDKPIFAEPSTFWNVKLPLIRARGKGFLKDIPKEGFVFNGHFYDEVAEAFPGLLPPIQNGAYLKGLDQFREEGRYLGMPIIVTEYGAWGNQKAFDSGRIIKATYQGMEYSLTNRKNRNRYIDFYSPLISGTQWVWEIKNGGVAGENAGNNILERGYPKAVSGDIMNFVYKDNGVDSFKGIPLKWEVLRIQRKLFFENNKFLWLVWRGKTSNAPTEVYIPRHFNLETTLVMTEKKLLFNLKDKFLTPTGESDEIFHKKDLPDSDIGGTRLFVFDDAGATEDQKDFHYLLVVDMESATPDLKALDELRHDLFTRIKTEKSPIYLTGRIKIKKPKTGYPYSK